MPPKGVKLGPPPVPSDADSPAMVQQRANAAGIADLELPKTVLTKLAKGSIPDNVKMQQDVVLALLRSSTLFISYLSTAAEDQAKARTGKTITASDVIKAVVELDFGPADNLVPLLEKELAAYRAHQQTVKASKKPPGPGRGNGPRKSAAGQSDVNMNGEAGEDGEEEDDGDEDDPADLVDGNRDADHPGMADGDEQDEDEVGG